MHHVPHLAFTKCSTHSCIAILWWFLGYAYAEVGEGQCFGTQEGFEQSKYKIKVNSSVSLSEDKTVIYSCKDLVSLL